SRSSAWSCVADDAAADRLRWLLCRRTGAPCLMALRDVAIAGGGVAGLATAALLRQQGVNIVIYDKLATPQPVGSGIILQPVGLHVLDRIGVGDRLRGLGARIERLYGKVTPSQRVVLDVRYRALGPNALTGVGVHRGALFEALFDAARQAGTNFEP